MIFRRRGVSPELPFDIALSKKYYFLQHSTFSTDIFTELETDS